MPKVKKTPWLAVASNGMRIGNAMIDARGNHLRGGIGETAKQALLSTMVAGTSGLKKTTLENLPKKIEKKIQKKGRPSPEERKAIVKRRREAKLLKKKCKRERQQYRTK